ncbi:MAG: GNAT family N-acetyltransferase, partial [Planctomycetes bacterium]|nr:GNAT family N-acetyltransferase [Planctomycetota bacterium]
DLVEPAGYLELNPMPADYGHYWIGHCVVDPQLRGAGLGRHLVRLSLDFAFRGLDARRVSLVVFPDNTSAIRCYRRAGFIDAGDQYKYFANTGRQHRMLQMTVDRGGYLALPVSHGYPAGR